LDPEFKRKLWFNNLRFERRMNNRRMREQGFVQGERDNVMPGSWVD
jgi:hypothetical protein